MSEVRLRMPFARPCSTVLPEPAIACADVLLRPGRAVRARVVEPLLDRVEAAPSATP